MLSQVNEAGEVHPVTFYSRKLLSRDERYSTVEKECLAIKSACWSIRVYLLGQPFKVQTDHRALEWLDRIKDNNDRLTRWSFALHLTQWSIEWERPMPMRMPCSGHPLKLPRDSFVAGELGGSVVD